MKNILLTFIFCCLIATSKAQTASVEKSTFGVQIGAVGVWVYNEFKLSNNIALRSEIGLSAKFHEYTEATLYLAPVITLEPRWYYNLKKRSAKEKDTAWNGADFISIQTSYVPDWFIIPIVHSYWISYNHRQISIIPTWGIRRNIGDHFNFEAGLGIGYEYIFEDDYHYNPNTGSFVAINVHFRIGYRF